MVLLLMFLPSLMFLLHPLLSLSSENKFFPEMTEFGERKKRTGSIIVRGRAATTEAKFSTELSVVTQQIVANLVTPTYVQCINPERSMYKVKIANVQLQDI